MDTKRYLAVSAVNLTFLLIGVLIGAIWEQSQKSVVHAQAKPEFEEISPALTTGSAAFATLLAGRIASDQIMVQGIDLLKFNENLLNALASKSFWTRAELQAIIDKSRADKILRMKRPQDEQPKKPNSAVTKPDNKKEEK